MTIHQVSVVQLYRIDDVRCLAASRPWVPQCFFGSKRNLSLGRADAPAAGRYPKMSQQSPSQLSEGDKLRNLMLCENRRVCYARVKGNE